MIKNTVLGGRSVKEHVSMTHGQSQRGGRIEGRRWGWLGSGEDSGGEEMETTVLEQQ